ncbi:MAG: LysR family transcriptional regulator [Fusobacterium gastrosuis]|uniref:LysR family transcriptional regulator n=1 Tax=Fusobacterium gastrosuis TaxID=1755100 RepID=UPI002A85DC89|nr:LysR family transcriptional regulator [Fusobacteriaceae bacterium]MDY4010529.1 LysR family transcriptional regulator [Fusobacterium gastrosuis]
MYNEMIYIYTIYEEGSFSKAAKKLYLTQSALSMAVQRIENNLNTILLDRTKRPLSLTLAGEAYIKKYLEISRLEKELLKELDDLSNLNKGELSFGGSQYILSYILLPVFYVFKKKYPHIKLNIIECSSDLLNSYILNGTIDICLKSEKIKDPFINHGLAFRDTLILAVPKAFIELFNLPKIYFTKEKLLDSTYLSFKNLPLEYLEKLPLIILSKGNNLYEITKKIATEHNLNLNIILEISQLVTALHLSSVGLGATLTTNILASKTFDNDLVYYKIDSLLTDRKFYFVTKSKGYLPKATLKFIEIAQDILNSNNRML